MYRRALPAIIAVVVLVLLASSCLYTVHEGELALRTRFGALLGPALGPGLHGKLPWDSVVRFDGRVLTQLRSGESFLTQDQHALIVDYSIRWRVRDPQQYYQATAGSETNAADRIYDIVKEGMKRAISSSTEQQVVTGEHAGITPELAAELRASARPLGVDLLDVRVQGLDLPDDVAASVYETMKQSFAMLANRRRAEGASSAAKIRASADRERTEIMANADREALRIKGAADASAADIYARAYASDPEFYAFYRSLQAYERSLGKSGDMLVISPDGEFFKYLRDPGHPARH